MSENWRQAIEVFVQFRRCFIRVLIHGGVLRYSHFQILFLCSAQKTEHLFEMLEDLFVLINQTSLVVRSFPSGNVDSICIAMLAKRKRKSVFLFIFAYHSQAHCLDAKKLSAKDEHCKTRCRLFEGKHQSLNKTEKKKSVYTLEKKKVWSYTFLRRITHPKTSVQCRAHWRRTDGPIFYEGLDNDAIWLIQQLKYLSKTTERKQWGFAERPRKPRLLFWAVIRILAILWSCTARQLSRPWKLVASIRCQRAARRSKLLGGLIWDKRCETTPFFSESLGTFTFLVPIFTLKIANEIVLDSVVA